MLKLLCTAKVREALDHPSKDMPEMAGEDMMLGDWYVNIFPIEHRKAIIFINETTLLSFIIMGVKKSNIQSIDLMAINGLTQLLQVEQFSDDEIALAFSGLGQVQIGKAENKSMIAHMNDLTSLYKHHIRCDGGLAGCNIGQIIHAVNNTPQRKLQFWTALETTKKILQGNDAHAGTIPLNEQNSGSMPKNMPPYASVH